MTPVTCPITTPEIDDYAESHTTPESPELYQLNRWVHLNMAQPRMISGAFQGRLLEMFSYMVHPRRVIEVGSYVGYSTICLARGLAPDGLLHAVEVNDEFEEIILHNLDEAGVAEKVKLHIGDALEVIPQIDECYDLAFIDADKVNTPQYYSLLLPRMNKGGFIMIDNILWSGKVLFPQSAGDKETLVLKEFNDQVQADPRVENILLPIRDGLMVCRVL